MSDTIITDSVRKQLTDFFDQYKFYNPGHGIEIEHSVAIDKGVKLELTGGDSHHFPDDGVVYRLECRLLFADEDIVPADDVKPHLTETTEYGQALQTELENLINEVFGGYREQSSIPEFFYRGKQGAGHCYVGLFDIPESSLAPEDTETVNLTMTIEETLEQEVPQSIADKGEEAVLEYVVDNWWRQLSREKKARHLGMVNAVLVPGRDEDYQDALAEGVTDIDVTLPSDE